MPGRSRPAKRAARLRAATLALIAAAALSSAPDLLAPVARADERRPARIVGPPDRSPRLASLPPVAGAFVYPVGDELDFTKPHAGEPAGFYVSDSYLVRRGRKHQRAHRGVDLSNGRGGSTVRAIASGVVIVADANALIRSKKTQRVKVKTVVNGTTVEKWTTRTRPVTRWRTGWGNYVVIRHMLPDGQMVHSLYAHLKHRSVRVKKGDVVAAGQPIALVGRTGRASSSHLHLEIRKSLPALTDDESLEPEDLEDATIEDRSFARLETLDPVSFLERHVRRFGDLERGTWQERYAFAACRDGILYGDEDRFDPDRSITRADFYRALASAFHLGRVEAKRSFASTEDALVRAGILDRESAREYGAGDHVSRSEALELLLRCLDQGTARGQNLAGIAQDELCRDFNRAFAGPEAALRAEREARTAAAVETRERREAAEAEYAKALAAAKVQGSAAARKRVKRRAVKAVVPVPRLDPGFESVARSDRDLTRAEACLLLASAFRIDATRASALEAAAARVAASPLSG